MRLKHTRLYFRRWYMTNSNSPESENIKAQGWCRCKFSLKGKRQTHFKYMLIEALNVEVLKRKFMDPDNVSGGVIRNYH